MKPWINEDIFKSWTEAQKRLWDSLCSAVPFQPPAGVEAWRETYLKNLATWEAAVRQTLSKEAAWVRRWVEQVAREKGAPELMTTWVRQMEEVLQRWVQTQNQWWDEYFAVLRRGSGFIAGSKQTVAESAPVAEPASVAEPSSVAEPVPIAEPASTAAAEPAVMVMESAAVTETSRPLAANEIAVEPAPTPPATEAVVEAATVPVVTSDSPSGDDLRLITGIGPALERKLRDLGICNYRQLATLGDEEIDRLETAIKAAGRIRRDDWIGQAKARHLQKYQEQL
ncbi:MAG TPA: hypothetical protein PK708_12940 [Candidatus Competibacter sp.]|nr:hypothetical protein [Candidatus Competibacter sp.]